MMQIRWTFHSKIATELPSDKRIQGTHGTF